MASTGIAVGLTKGFPTQKLEGTSRPASNRKLSKRTKLCRQVIREVTGFSPYEKRMLDILKTGGGNSEKRMYKLAKKRLGTHKRAQKKRDEIKRLYMEVRARQAQH